MAHSPGPWTAGYSSYGDEWWFGGEKHGQWVVSPSNDGFEIVMAGHGRDRGDKDGKAKAEAAANAKLIAAAPDLYDVLKGIDEYVQSCGRGGLQIQDGSVLHARIKVALAKAEATP